MYKTETHLHTDESSLCGKIPAAELVRLHAKAGYTTILVTDHFGVDVVKRIAAPSWEETVKRFFAGYYAALEAAAQYGMYILPSPEFAFPDNPNHYLAVGAAPDFFLAHPELADITLPALHTLLNENGLMLIQAHPFRSAYCIPDPRNVDGLEVLNSPPQYYNPLHTKAAMLVAEIYHLPITAGSDTHRPEDVARSGMYSEQPITSIEDYIRLLKDGALTPIPVEDTDRE